MRSTAALVSLVVSAAGCDDGGHLDAQLLLQPGCDNLPGYPPTVTGLLVVVNEGPGDASYPCRSDCWIAYEVWDDQGAVVYGPKGGCLPIAETGTDSCLLAPHKLVVEDHYPLWDLGVGPGNDAAPPGTYTIRVILTDGGPTTNPIDVTIPGCQPP